MRYCVVLCVATLLLTACPATIGKVVTDMGYTQLQRQTDFMKPGTIVAIKKAFPFEATRVCTQSGALGNNFKPDESRTLTSTWQHKTSSGLKVSASYKQALNAKIGYNAVKDITLEFANTRVYETSDQAVIEAAMRHETSEACKIAITNRHDQGLPMTMISSALEADVTYKIDFEEGISSELQFALSQDIAPELSGNAKVEGKDRISGKQLYFGIIDDRQLLTAFSKVVSGLPQLAASDTVRRGERRLISKDMIVIGTEESPE